MRKILFAGVAFSLLVLAACRSGPRRAPAIGEAYAGPATLALRKNIPLESSVVARVKHGDRLEIIQHRRLRFFKVRTRSGAEGWTEDYLLLTAGEIASLRQAEQRARTLPSQGLAGVYEVLNVHTEPNRWAPSFFQIRPGEKVDVVAQSTTPRTPLERQPLLPRKPKPRPAQRKHTKSKWALPHPLAPPVPANWLELSKTPPEVSQAIAAEKAAARQAVPTDDWSLVRNAQGQSGWVLRQRLFMAIPDEVAQYAEGHRITSYFSLGNVPDGDQMKYNWLWTTISRGDHPYDFDSFRVFIWNVRRHRYETAYIQRNVQGYFPVLVSKTPPGFSVCLQKEDGSRMRRSYAFLVNIVRFTGEQPCPARPAVAPSAASAPAGVHAHADSLYSRLKALAKSWFR
jgi:hypothetical protein